MPAELTTRRLTIGMDYPGAVISKNHMWAGGRRGKLHATAQGWKDALAESVRLLFLAEGLTPQLPLSITVSGHFRRRGQAPDLHNLLELVADAVEAGTGLNDRDFATHTIPPTYGALVPAITVTLEIASTVPPTNGTVLATEEKEEEKDAAPRRRGASAAARSITRSEQQGKRRA